MFPSTDLIRIFFGFGTFSLGLTKMNTWSMSPIHLCMLKKFTERYNLKKVVQKSEEMYKTIWSKKKQGPLTLQLTPFLFLQ